MKFEDLHGVGQNTAEKLRSSGIVIEDFTISRVEELAEKTGLSESHVKEIITKNFKNSSLSVEEQKYQEAYEKSETDLTYDEWIESLKKQNNRFRK